MADRLLPGCKTLGSSVTRDREPQECFEELDEAGWEEVGDGVYARCFISPDGDRVLKFAVGHGQRATVQTALDHPDNPHLPRIYGVLYDVGDYGLVYEAEVLQSFVDDNEEFDWDDERTWPDAYRKWAKRWNPDENENRIRFGPNGPMKDALKALCSAKDAGWADWDVHPGNVMVRPSDGTLVLNDLLA